MRANKDESVGAVILAAGSSQRMGGTDKMFVELNGKPLLAHVIETFQSSDAIDKIVIVMSNLNQDLGRKLVAEYKWSKVGKICPGGLRRQDSVKYGLGHLKGYEWVVIHDGARPLVTKELIEQGLYAAGETGAAIAAVPVTDTIKASDENHTIVKTLDRQNLWAAQTPQIFRFAIINEAYRSVRNTVTDDAMLVEQAGGKVKLYMGSYDNIKITTPDDLHFAEILFGQRTL